MNADRFYPVLLAYIAGGMTESGFENHRPTEWVVAGLLLLMAGAKIISDNRTAKSATKESP